MWRISSLRSSQATQQDSVSKVKKQRTERTPRAKLWVKGMREDASWSWPPHFNSWLFVRHSGDGCEKRLPVGVTSETGKDYRGTRLYATPENKKDILGGMVIRECNRNDIITNGI